MPKDPDLRYGPRRRLADRSTDDDQDLHWWAFWVWFAFCAVTGLAVLGIVVWAIISLVNHITAP